MMGSKALWPRVVVIGGSLGGLSAALWLRDVGCDVEVFERTPVPLEDRGAGIVLHPATIRYLAAHRLPDVEQIGAAANWFRHLTRDGSVRRLCRAGRGDQLRPDAG